MASHKYGGSKKSAPGSSQAAPKQQQGPSGELKRLTQAFSTITVGAYKPLDIGWVSRQTLNLLVVALADRTLRLQTPDANGQPQAPSTQGLNLASNIALTSATTQTFLDSWSAALELDNLTLAEPDSAKKIEDAPDVLREMRRYATRALGIGGAKGATLAYTGDTPAQTNVALTDGPQDLIAPFLWPGDVTGEVVSPLGLLHLYRHHFFNGDEMCGPLEQVMTVGPKEELEIVIQTTRRSVYEEERETTQEVETERSTEATTSEEITDKVSQLVEKNKSVSMSASAGGSIGVFKAEGSVTGSYSESEQNAREHATTVVKEITTRASERMKKTFTLRTKTTQEMSATNTSRRLVKNETTEALNYGLRRAFRGVTVRIQDLGPRLVWQVLIEKPARMLASSRLFVSTPPEPQFPIEEPKAGSATATVVVYADPKEAKKGWIVDISTTFRLPTPDHCLTSFTILSATSDGQDVFGNAYSFNMTLPPDYKAVPSNADVPVRITARWPRKPGRKTVTIHVGIRYAHIPSAEATTAWTAAKSNWTNASYAPWVEQILASKQKHLRLERGIPPRPAADLRREERLALHEALAMRLLGASASTASQPNIELEALDRLFDVEGSFAFLHPSWWRPSEKELEPYNVVEDSAPAPLGTSLGWDLQVDGDQVRNEFLNTPYARLCVPIRAGMERQAMKWLCRHTEGTDVRHGSNLDATTTAILEDLEKIRLARTRYQAEIGPDEVAADAPTVAASRIREWMERVAVKAVGAQSKLVWIRKQPGDSEAGDGSALIERSQLYPVFHEYQVTVPVDGFIYERITIAP